MNRRTSAPLSRRAFLGAAGAAGATSVAAQALASGAATAALDPPHAAARAAGAAGAALGQYASVPLRADDVTVGLMQTRSLAVDGRRPANDRRRNLEHMCSAIDLAQRDGGHKDWLAFHELPLSGWDHWTRGELMRIAIDVPGAECAALAAKAREHDCYLSFGAFAHDAEWPGRVLSLVVFISPAGAVIARQWRLRRVPGTSTDRFVSTVEDLLEEYVERHGWDAVVPVVRTNIGNLAASALADEPELYRVMAMKGAEFVLRVACGASPPVLNGAALQELAVWCRTNRVYGGFVNSAADGVPLPGHAGAAGGGSTLFGPDGRTLRETLGPHEEVLVARLPLAEFRRGHRIPRMPRPLYADLGLMAPA